MHVAIDHRPRQIERALVGQSDIVLVAITWKRQCAAGGVDHAFAQVGYVLVECQIPKCGGHSGDGTNRTGRLKRFASLNEEFAVTFHVERPRDDAGTHQATLRIDIDSSESSERDTRLQT